MGSPAVKLWEALPSVLWERLRDRDSWLPPSSLHCDELRAMNRRFTSVLGDHSEYLRYLHRPDVRDLWDLREASDCECTCAIATVPRRGKPGSRKILMVCPLNSITPDIDAIFGEGC